ncbi:hypothetical protein BDN70DRAFT_821734, partial [Pholiota conissans]
SSKQKADLQEKRNTLYNRIQQWRGIQLAYTPMVGSLLLQPSPSIDTGEQAVVAEEIPLYLPSSITASLLDSTKDIASKELRLRKAQADEALEDIRRGRRMITGLAQFKKLNICGAGNKANTRMRTLYDRLQRRIQRAANRYRAARNVLHQLDPDGTWTVQFHQLDAIDIRGPGRQPDDPVRVSKRRFEQSWIWMVNRSIRDENTEEEFDDIMRAEWAKMLARRDRWEEEYQLVIEEMRRTVAYLRWKSVWWRNQVGRRVGIDSAQYQGLRAYAMRQADLLERLAESCITKWVPALSEAGVVSDWIEKRHPLHTDPRNDSDDEGEGDGNDIITESQDIFDSYSFDD